MSDVRSHELAPQYRREGKACYSWQCPSCGRWRSVHATTEEAEGLPRPCRRCQGDRSQRRPEDRSQTARLPDIRVRPETEGRPRLRAFSLGWNDAVDRGEDYSGLDYMTWQGLGNRIGHQVGPISDELKADLYAVLAKVKEWQAEQGVREHPEREAVG